METSDLKMQDEKRKCLNQNIDKLVKDDKNKKICLDEDDTTTKNDSKESTPILFNGQDINSLSKSQMKKYQKMLSWQANKKEKRQKEKLRAKQRKKEAKLNNIDTGPSRKQLKQSKMCDSLCKTSVVIDLSFDDLMIPKVIINQVMKPKYYV